MAQTIPYTLFDVTYRVASELGIVSEGVATGGSATTLIDTNDLTQANDYWNGGSVWILRDSAEAAAAPEGEMAVVSDFVNSTGTASLRNFAAGTGDALTESAAAGDRYAIGKKRYPLHRIAGAVNSALADMGPIETTDTTTITTAASQTEYTLPTIYDLREVWLQTKTNDSDDNKWVLIKPGNWYIQKTATGTANTLVIPKQLPVSRALKLVYLGEHAKLDDASDKIDETVPMGRLVYEAVMKCLMWRRQKVGDGDPTLLEQIQYFQGQLLRHQAEQPIQRTRVSKSKFLTMGDYVEKDAFTYPGPA